MGHTQRLVAVVAEPLLERLSGPFVLRRAASLHHALVVATPGERVVWSSLEPVGSGLKAIHLLRALARPGEVTVIGHPLDRGLDAWSLHQDTAVALTYGDLGLGGTDADSPVLGDSLTSTAPLVGFKRSVLALADGGQVVIRGVHAQSFHALDAQAESPEPEEGFNAFCEIGPAAAHAPRHCPLAEVRLGPTVWRSDNALGNRILRAAHEETLSVTLYAVCDQCGQPATIWGGEPADGLTTIQGRCHLHAPSRPIDIGHIQQELAAQGVNCFVVAGPVAQHTWAGPAGSGAPVLPSRVWEQPTAS